MRIHVLKKAMRHLMLFFIGDVGRVKQKVFYFLFPSRGAKKGVIPQSLRRKMGPGLALGLIPLIIASLAAPFLASAALLPEEKIQYYPKPPVANETKEPGRVLGVSTDVAAPPAVFKSTVRIKQMGFDSNGVLKSINYGSGVWVGKNLVLTAAHVVTLEGEFGGLPSIIKISLTKPDGSLKYNVGNARVIALDKKMDIALLFVERAKQSNFTDAELYDHAVALLASNIQVGQRVKVAGYPAIGGETISVTEGVISGKKEAQGVKLLKTDAGVSFGTSGAAVFNLSNRVIGIVTQSAADSTGQLGYAVSAEQLIPWFDKVKSNPVPSYDKNLEVQSNWIDRWWAVFDERTDANGVTYTLDHPDYPLVSMQTPNSNWRASSVKINSMALYYKPLSDCGCDDLSVNISRSPVSIDLADLRKLLSDNQLAAVPVSDAVVNGEAALKINLYGVVQYIIPFRNFLITVSYSSTDSTMTQEAEAIIQTLMIDKQKATPAPDSPTTFFDLERGWSMSTTAEWAMIVSQDKQHPLEFVNKNDASQSVSVSLEKLTNGLEQYSNEQWVGFLTLFGNEGVTSFANYSLQNVKSVVKVVSAPTKDNPLGSVTYFIPLAGLGLTVSYSSADAATFEAMKNSVEGLANTIQLTSFGLGSSDLEEPLVQAIDYNLIKSTTGKILLQVERNGEAWYVEPLSLQKYYLKDGPTAYEALRAFGLGVTNSNLDKIPVGVEPRFQLEDTDGDGLDDKLEEGIGTNPVVADTDGDGFSDGAEVKNGYNPFGAGSQVVNQAVVNNLKGKILLQVERNGEAWYVNPADGKRYYLRDGEAAYQVMRFLSLGVTNDNLRKIPVGRLSAWYKITRETPAPAVATSTPAQ